MEKSKVLAMITGGVLIVDFLLPADVAMGVVLGFMGIATIYTTFKEWREDER